MSVYPEKDEDELFCIFCLCECNEKNNTKDFGCNCKPIYHKECINKWIDLYNKCPICSKSSFIQTEIIEIEVTETRNEILILNNRINLLIKVVFSGFCVYFYVKNPAYDHNDNYNYNNINYNYQ
tara:strand:+ start:7798 stop:8169 length:372 start_codon:yes stop_codon:yes gene_type:complete